MRSLLLLPFALLTLSACATGPKVYEGRMPLEVFRSAGEPPRLGDTLLVAGEYAETSPFVFRIWFDTDGETLGAPYMTGWSMRLGDYCRNQPGWVRSVLIGPEGQVWRGDQLPVPAGPDRPKNWAGGPAGPLGRGYPAPAGLVEAVAAGGRFTLRLENDAGEVLHEEVLDTLTPARRQQLFAANLKAFRATDPALAVREPPVVVLSDPAPPVSPRPCP